jgi:Tol biopolymer transport system component
VNVFRLLAISVLLALGVTACGDDDAGTTPSGTLTPWPSAPPPTLSPDAPVPVPLYPGELHLQPAAGGPSTKIASYPGWFMDSAWSSSGDFAVSVYLSSHRTELHVFDHESFNDRFAVLDGMAEELLWSPDGSLLAFTHYDGDRRAFQTAVLSRDVRSLARFTLPTSLSGNFRPIGWTADNLLLTLVENFAVVEFDPASGSSRRVVDTGQVHGAPSISPDRTELLVPICELGPPDSLAVFDIRTGTREDVLPGGACVITSVAWSPDAARIAYAVIDYESDRGGLYVVDRGGHEPRRLVEGRYHITVDWSPDGDTILASTSPCYGCEASFFDLHAVDPDTGQAKLVAQGSSLHLTADKSTAAYVAWGGAVVVKDLATAAERQIVPAEPEVSLSVAGWRPGTDSLLVTRAVSTDHEYDFALNLDGTGLEPYPWPAGADQVFPTVDQTHLAIIETDGEQQHEPGRLSILDTPGNTRADIPLPNVYWVQWAPDNRHLLATVSDDIHSPSKLFLVDTAGPSITPLDVDPYTRSTAWSPDSRTIAFGKEYDEPGIFLLDTETLEITSFLSELFGGGASYWGQGVSDLEWSPDSGRLVFSSDGDIQIINAAGTGIRRLTTAPENEFNPRFSPDGRNIAFRRAVGNAANIVLIDIESGQERTIYDRSTDSGGDRLVWSPDGKRLAFTASTLEGQGIFIINNDGTGLYQLAAGTAYIVGLDWLTNDRISFRLGPTNVM